MDAFNSYVSNVRDYLKNVDNDLKIVDSEEPLFNRFVGKGFVVETSYLPGSFMITLITMKQTEGNIEIEGTNFKLFSAIFSTVHSLFT